MAFIPVPGVISTVLSGLVGVQPWAVTYHWQGGSSTSPWSQSDADLLTHTMATAWNSALKTHTATNIGVNQVTAVDLTNSSGVGSLWTQTLSLGTGGSPLEPSSMATVIQNRIASRYRGGHPRTYWAMLGPSDMYTESQWLIATVGTINTQIAAWVNAVRAPAYSFGTGTLNHVIPRYTYTYTDDTTHHKYLKHRSGLNGVFTVQSYNTNQLVGSQRRRLTV